MRKTSAKNFVVRPDGGRCPAVVTSRLEWSDSAQHRGPVAAPVSAANEVQVGDSPTGIAFDGSSLWVTNQFSKTVSRISPTGSLLGSYPVGNNPTGVACGRNLCLGSKQC